MATLNTLIFCFRFHGGIYFKRHDKHTSYDAAITYLLRELQRLTKPKATKRGSLSEVGGDAKTDSMPAAVSTGGQEVESLEDQIKKIVTRGIEIAGDGWVVRTPKYAKDIEDIYTEWKRGDYDDVEANEEALKRKVEEIEQQNRASEEALKKRIAELEQKLSQYEKPQDTQGAAGDTKTEDPKDQLISAQQEVIALQRKSAEEKQALEEKIRQLEEANRKLKETNQKLTFDLQSSRISQLPNLSGLRGRSLSDTSSQHSAGGQSTQSAIANEHKYIESAKTVLGERRFALVLHLISLKTKAVHAEAKSSVVHPYRELIANLCKDALSDNPKSTNSIVASWDKDQKIVLTQFESLKDEPNPRHSVTVKLPKPRDYTAGYLLGYAIQKGYLGADDSWANGFVDIPLAKELSGIKPPVLRTGMGISSQGPGIPVPQPRPQG